MKKPGGGGGAAVDKKRSRRSYGESSTETPPKQAAKKDVFQIFAEKVRDHKKLESRWAVLQETRVEYFRGKDFVSFLRNHPELKDILESDRNSEIEDIANILLRKNLIVRCDRVVKTLRPGKKKLSTWPAHLEIFPEQVFSDNDAFFAWTFVNRRPLWQTLLSFFWPVLTLAICLFPVYPHSCKLFILYFCAGLLLLILTLLILRGLVFGTLWILIGKRVWFFPNILAEEATLKELFQFWPKKDEDERPKWTARLFYAIVAVLVFLLLRHHAPDEAARARYQKRVSNIIDDVLEWSPSLALSGMMEKQTVFNATDPDSNVTDSSKSTTEEMAQPEVVKEETIRGEHEVEESIENAEDTDHQQSLLH
ncbi:translocation Sec62 [Olea europaea subsp. europaea]|uniref:Translocation protein SEC62 n=1 Tax=Olea europaea subsp. europaea TaxID=158383 RepID=A0A8S0VAE8_OLEEU|nr:translocation Sec62 [Olea europaea subsp. europaea]